jgi:hypothetical protein
MRHKLILLSALLCLASPAWSLGVVTHTVPDAKKVGEARLTYAFWDVYDATLYAPKGMLHPTKPYALSIRYFRQIDGKAIAERSVEEIEKQGFSDAEKLASWHEKMREIFPNVQDGTVLTAVFIPNKKTIFYHGSEKIGVIKDAEFTKRFADIWLGEKTSEPLLREELLGRS